MRRWRLAEFFASAHLALALVTVATVCLIGAFEFPFLHAELSLDLPAWMPRSLAARVRPRNRSCVASRLCTPPTQRIRVNNMSCKNG